MPNTLTDAPTPQWGEPAGWQLPLAQLCDSALPTGAFSHSFGLETYICEGVVDGEASFVSWLRALVSTQLTFSEGLGLRLAFEAVAANDWEAIAHLDALLVAQAVPIQVRRAGVTMGRRLLTIARLALEGTDGGRLLSRYAAWTRKAAAPTPPSCWRSPATRSRHHRRRSRRPTSSPASSH